MSKEEVIYIYINFSIDEFREAFLLFDKNGDGTVTADGITTLTINKYIYFKKTKN